MNKLTKGMLAGAALLVAPFTQAAVIEWSYNVTTEWIDAEFSAGNGTQVVNSSLISWGSEGGDHTNPDQGTFESRSALEITDSPAAGSVFTNDMMPVPTNTITHFNNILSNTFATLTSAQVRTTLTLTPTDPAGPAAPDFMTDFFVDFIETPNESPCDFPTDTVCDDIFVIQFGALNSEFEYDGVTYFLSIVEMTGSLNPLPDATCAEAGVASGCLGFTTPESAFTPVQFGFLITSLPVNVPEPAMLGLFGLGLLGLRAFGRRRLAKK